MCYLFILYIPLGDLFFQIKLIVTNLNEIAKNIKYHLKRSKINDVCLWSKCYLFILSIFDLKVIIY
jgi:hypothetical protein